MTQIPYVETEYVVQRHERQENKGRDVAQAFSYARQKRNQIANCAHNDQYQRICCKDFRQNIIKIIHDLMNTQSYHLKV
jgi:hypothetical protein